MTYEKSTCPICGAPCSPLPAVDFNRACLGELLPPAGIPIEYVMCQSCSFCFAPEICAWPMEEFEKKIYNDDYVRLDPDYVDARPKASATMLLSMFSQLPPTVRHLDYGGGNGKLAGHLRAANWQSTSYDPFVDRTLDVGELGKFDLITAFEVFEHVPDVAALMSNLSTLLVPNGVVLFSTLLSDGHLRAGAAPDWWYLSPRNGHISLFSSASLAALAPRYGWGFGSFSEGTHVFCREVPPWATHLMGGG